MGRKSSLSEKDWDIIGKRMLNGTESSRSLAREFGTSEASIRRRYPMRRKEIKDVANQLVAAEVAFKKLPIPSQIDALSLVDQIKSMMMNLSGAASLGAATAFHLSAMANDHAQQVNSDSSQENMDALKTVMAFSQTANEAAKPAMQLLAANKVAVENSTKEPDRKINFAPIDDVEASKAYQKLMSG